jgi:hypothetical protein
MMDIIRDNIFLIILLFVGAISQWLKARAEAKQGQEPDYDPAEIEEMLEEAERRHSRPAVPPPLPPTAFPQPPGSVIAPAPTLRRKSREPESAPPAYDASAELARQQELADKLKEMKRTRGARQTADGIPPRKRSASEPIPAAGVSLKSRLGSRRELRQAFVLREILGKPVGLR